MGLMGASSLFSFRLDAVAMKLLNINGTLRFVVWRELVSNLPMEED